MCFTYRRKFSPIGEYTADLLHCSKLNSKISDGIVGWENISRVLEHFEHHFNCLCKHEDYENQCLFMSVCKQVIMLYSMQ